MEVKPRFTGTGGELFGKMLVGCLLTMITLGIYSPWFTVSMTKYIYEKTTLQGTGKGDLKLDFNGTGGELFVLGLVGGILTGITLGIYGAWFMCKLQKYFTEHTVAKAEDGTTYSGTFEGSGGAYFVTFLVGGLLTMITAGIYMPWFICKIYKKIFLDTSITENGNKVGTMDFVGNGLDLFVMMLVGGLLSMITLGIYSFWYQVKLFKFMTNNMRIKIGEATYAGDFVGEGFEYFKINIIGMILCGITLGIYSFWLMANLLRFQIDNSQFKPAAA